MRKCRHARLRATAARRQVARKRSPQRDFARRVFARYGSFYASTTKKNSAGSRYLCVYDEKPPCDPNFDGTPREKNKKESEEERKGARSAPERYHSSERREDCLKRFRLFFADALEVSKETGCGPSRAKQRAFAPLEAEKKKVRERSVRSTPTERIQRARRRRTGEKGRRGPRFASGGPPSLLPLSLRPRTPSWLREIFASGRLFSQGT